MKQVVAEKCLSNFNFNFNFDFVANGLIDVKFSVKCVPSVVLIMVDFKQCMRASSWLHLAVARGQLAPFCAASHACCHRNA